VIPRTIPAPAAPGDAARAPERAPLQGWRSLLLVYAITSAVESMGVFQVFAFLPTRLS
jgi:hypothetical protein